MFTDDSSAVNIHGTVPTLWLKLSMVFLNLVVWVDAAVQLQLP